MTATHSRLPTPSPGHACPGLEPAASASLTRLLLAEPWLSRALAAVAASGLPDAWIGAGVLRDVVWGQRYGGFDPAEVKDIDVAFFDPACLTRKRDLAAQEVLAKLAELPWEATNQAAVHTWYHEYFGGVPVQPFASVHEAVATWPETATCVAVRQLPGDGARCPGGIGGPAGRAAGSRQVAGGDDRAASAMRTPAVPDISSIRVVGRTHIA